MMEKKGAGPRKKKYFLNEKILIQGITNGKLICTYDDEHYFVNDKIHILYNCKINLVFITGILNSKFMNYFAKSLFGDYLEIKINQLKLLPIPVTISLSQETQITDLVNQILAAKKENPEANTQKLEDEIDYLVYKLYDLTYDEVLIVDPETTIERGEY